MSDYRKEPHWTRGSDGAWAVCVPGDKVSSGTHITVSKSDGSYESTVVGRYLELGSYGHLYEADTSASDRISRADGTVPIEIDKSKKKGIFAGSGGAIYTTSLSKCSCMDFKERRQACKHMYRLSKELGEDVFPPPESAGNRATFSFLAALVGLAIGVIASGILSVVGFIIMAVSFLMVGIFRIVEEKQKKLTNPDKEEIPND